MSEGIGHDISLGLLLEAIIADGRGRPQARLDVAFLEDMPQPLSMVGPNPSEEIGLQLQSNRQPLGLGLAHPLLARMNLVTDPLQVLDVMTDFVSEYVSLREFSRRVESIRQFIEEHQVDVNSLIGRTVEGPDGRGGISAAGGRSILEEDQGRFPVLPACLSEEVRPDELGIAENSRYELLGFVVGWRGRRPALRGSGLLILLLDKIENLSGIGAEESRHEHDDQRADSTDRDPDGLDSPPVLNILAPGFVLPTHGCLT